MSDDDFQQKLKELGFQDNDFESLPNQSVQPAAQPQDTSDMDKLDAIRLEAANAQKAQAPVPPPPPTTPEEDEDETPDQSSNAPAQPAAAKPVSQPSQAPAAPEASQNPLETNPELNDAAIKAAQQQSRVGTLVANLGNAGSTFAALATGNKPEERYYEDLAKQANVPVEQIMQRRDALMKNMTLGKQMLDYQATKLNVNELQQTTDANSDVSKGARALILQFEPKLRNLPEFDKMSAKDVKDFADHFLETEARVEASKANRQYTQTLKQGQIDNQKQQFNAREEDKIGKEVNALSTNSRSALGLAGRNLIAADRALGVLDMKTVTPQDLNSVSADISGIISGTPTVSGTRHQEYNTLAKSASGFWQTLTSNPTDVNAPQIKQHLKDVIQKMRDISTDTINKNMEAVKSAHPTFVKNNPTYFENIAKTYSDQLGQPSPAAGASAVNPATPGQPQAPAQSQNLVTVRSKKTGTTKTLDPQTAQKYLADPGFEQVQ